MSNIHDVKPLASPKPFCYYKTATTNLIAKSLRDTIVFISYEVLQTFALKLHHSGNVQHCRKLNGIDMNKQNICN